VDWPAICAAVIPACNEAATIGALTHEVRRALPAVVVVDDGSADRTAARAGEAGAHVRSHARNRGKGAALKTGLDWAADQGYSWAITLDADGQHRPEDMPAFFRCAENTGAALVVGNRFCRPDALPWLRRAVNRWMSRQLSRHAGLNLPDTQCGYRLIDLRAWAGLRIETNRFEIESEALLAFLRAGHRVEFVPIQVVGQSRPSHIRPVRDAWRWIRWWHGSRGG
jgi:glycosyltransferase involved in cell wall biosynthesis